VPATHADPEPDAAPRRNAPGDGERRALRGYLPQYKISAAHILAACEQGTLVAVAVADPEAGRVDDLQVLTDGPAGPRVDAFQVKWSQDAAPLADAELRALIADAVDGRTRLSGAWTDRRDAAGAPPVRRIVVHLHTNRPLSTASLRGDAGRGRDLTLPQFLQDVWRPARNGAVQDLGDVPEPWRDYVEQLAVDARVTVPELLAAAPDIAIETGRELPEDAELEPARATQMLRDINALVLGLMAAVTDKRNLVVVETLPFLELVGEGLADRWQPRSTHHFPVPPDAQAMVDTERALATSLDELSQGYLFLTGSPGSGKSTLLTSALTGDPRLVARYYAFVPEDDTATRGEAHALLQDLLLALDRRDRLRTLAPPREQLSLLRQRLRTRLQELGAQARAAGAVAIVLIDGLDHVLRDPAPELPLLNELLPAGEVPDGVLFVVGTRNVEDLPEHLQAEARLSGRHIRMTPMSRTATLALAAHAGLPTAIAERVWQVSDGHPLLARTFTKLATGREPQDALEALAGIPPLDGEAMRYYETVWGDLHDDQDLVVLLGLVCRLRGPIDLAWLQAGGSSPASIEHLGRLEHLFRSGSGRRWTFFHDSFREFLRARTALRLGVHDPDKERALHAELAERCAATPADQPQAWEQLHHRLRAGETAAVMRGATPEFFRAQMLALRPPGDVLPDVREAAAALAAEHDAVAAVRLSLAAAECRMRDYQQSVDRDFLRLLLDLGHEDAALAHLRHVREIAGRDDRTTLALRLVVDLHDRGLKAEAARVFGDYEPLELLSNRPRPDAYTAVRSLWGTLYAWAQAAVLVHGAAYVIEHAARLVLTRADLDHGDDPAQAAALLRNNVLWSAAGTAAYREDEDAARALVAAFDDDDLGRRVRAATLLDFADAARRAGKTECAAEHLDRALDGLKPGALDEDDAIQAAELLFRLGRPADAADWVSALAPIVLPPSASNDRDDQAWRLLLKRLRLHAALDGALEPVVVFPDSSQRYEQARVIVARHVVVLGNLCGRQWRGEPVAAAEVTGAVQRVFALWDHGSRRDVRDLWSALGGRRVIAEGSIALARALGRDALRALWEWWEQRWAQPGNARSGGLEIVGTFASAGIGAVSTRERLRAYAAATALDLDAEFSTWIEIAHAWLQADDADAAREALTHATAVSFGIGWRKDYQLTTWIQLLRPLLEGPGGAVLADWLVDRIADLDERAEAGAAEDAARTLLEVVGSARPGDVLAMGRALRDRGVLDVDDLVTATLGAIAATAGEGWWTIVAEILVPIGAAPIDLERARAAAPDRATLQRRLRAVADRVAVEGRPSDRRAWRRALIDAASPHGLGPSDLGLAPSDLTVGDETPERHTARDDDEPAPSTDPPTLDELRARAQGTTEGAGPGAELAAAELAAGDRDEAWNWARQAVERSTAQDWNRMWSGGPALRAARVLHAIDGPRARPLIFARYAAHAAEDSFLLGSIADDLDHVIDVFAPVDGDAVAREVLVYVAALAGVPAPDLSDPGPAVVDQPHPTGSAGSALEPRLVAQLVAWLLGELHLLAWASAQRALLALLRHGDPTAASAQAAMLADASIPPERIIDVVRAAIADPPTPLPDQETMVAWLTAHATGPRLDLRAGAADLLDRLGAPAPPNPPARDAPASLQLVVSRAPEVLAGAADIGANDLDEMLGYDEHEIARLARSAGVDRHALAERIRARAADHAARLPTDRQAAEGSTILGWGFVRPSAQAVAAAQHEVAAELVDAGLLPARVALAALRSLTASHGDLLSRRPARRPPCVATAAPLAERATTALSRAWIDDLGDAAARLARDDDGWAVIGEVTELALLDRYNTREERDQGLALIDAPALFTPVRRALGDARDVGPLPPGASLIMRNALAGLSFADGYIGLHPEAARAAGLAPDPDDPLAWRLDGSPVVRSVWWRSGFACWPPHYDRDEVGDGWLVVATPEAVAALLAAFPEVQVGWAVRRMVRNDDGDQLPTAAATGTRPPVHEPTAN